MTTLILSSLKVTGAPALQRAAKARGWRVKEWQEGAPSVESDHEVLYYGGVGVAETAAER